MIGILQHERGQKVTIRSFKNKYKGKRIFMIGNGPSLNKTPLDMLHSEYSFAMNRISLLYDNVRWRPSFFVCTTLNIEREEWRRDIIKTISLGIPCFIWDKLKRYIEPYHFKNVYYINCTHGDKVTDKSPDSWWSSDITERVCKFGTSMLPALQIAVFMGFNPIYLLGCDLGFQTGGTEGDNSGSAINNHNQKSGDPNHFDPNYGTPGCPPDILNMNMAAAHQLAFRVTSKIGVEIKNATNGGHLNIYPRVNLFESIHTPNINPDNQSSPIMNEFLVEAPLNNHPMKSQKRKYCANVVSNSMKINIIDVGSAGSMPEPWKSHKTIIGKRLSFEPRDNENVCEKVISLSATLWDNDEDRNFYIYQGLDGSGSSLFLQNYGFVLKNFESLKNIGPNTLAHTWLVRSLPIEVKRVTCKTLDNTLRELRLTDKFHFIKIDAQGAEYQILRGSEKYLLNDCYGMQLELFTLPMYKKIKLYDEVVAYLNNLGFDLVKKFAPHGTFNSQCDCVFLRRDIEDNITKTLREIYGLSESQNLSP